MSPTREDYLASIRRDAALVADAVRRNRAAAVRHCPGWTVADLVIHLGVVHRWAAEAVHADSRPRHTKERWAVDTDHPDLAGWYESCAADVVGVLEGVDPDAPSWTFGRPPTARFWLRRQAQETAVHRWDAELAAAGAPAPFDPDMAADGVDEALDAILLRRRAASEAEAAGETFHFHRTDGDGEWIVRFPSGGEPEVERAHAKGDVAFRGTAEELLLFLWNRADPPEVFGDPDGPRRWLELVPAL